MRKCVYIGKGGKCKISAKNKMVNRFTKCVNRSRQLNDKQDELWRLIHIRHLLNQFKYSWKKIDTIQILMNRFNQSQRVFMIRFNIIWIDSNMENENLMLEKFDLIQIFEDEDWLDSRKFDSIQIPRKGFWHTHTHARNHMAKWGLVC